MEVQQIPKKKRNRSSGIGSSQKRPSTMSVLSIPKEIWVKIFSGLPVRDITALAKSCRYFRDIMTCATVWKEASFFRAFPYTGSNLALFYRAARCNNFEALVKLAFLRLYLRLYDERLPLAERKKSIDDQAKEAAFYFISAERLASTTFSWIFLRPPWQARNICCKSKVFTSIMGCFRHLDLKYILAPEKYEAPDGRLAYILSQVFLKRGFLSEAQRYLSKAVELGWYEAELHQWAVLHNEQMYYGFAEQGAEIAAIRDLRSIVSYKPRPDIWGLMKLGLCYVKNMLGGEPEHRAQAFIRALFQSSTATNVDPALTGVNGINSSIRYILVDWLAEVSINVGLDTELLMNVVAIVDLCLLHRSFRLTEIQLLGVAALCITCRACCDEILTVQEASWYTDNTYSHEDVVEMMSDIVTVVRGNVVQVTNYYFTHLLYPVNGLGDFEEHLCDYVAEMCLLHSHMTQYSPAHMAASIVLHVRIWQEFDEAWPEELEEMTGFSAEDLTACVLNINECLQDEIHLDSQEVPLMAVRHRFKDPESFDLTDVKCISDKELIARLGILVPNEKASKEDEDDESAEELCSISESSCTVPSDKKETDPKPSFCAADEGSDSGEDADDESDTSTLADLEALFDWSNDEEESSSDSSSPESLPKSVERNVFSSSSNDHLSSGISVPSGLKCIESVQKDIKASRASSFKMLADGEKVACGSVDQRSMVLGSSQQAGQGPMNHINTLRSSSSADPDQGFDFPTAASSHQDSASSEEEVELSSSSKSVLQVHEVQKRKNVQKLQIMKYIMKSVADAPGVGSECARKDSPADIKCAHASEDEGPTEKSDSQPPYHEDQANFSDQATAEIRINKSSQSVPGLDAVVDGDSQAEGDTVEVSGRQSPSVKRKFSPNNHDQQYKRPKPSRASGPRDH